MNYVIKVQNTAQRAGDNIIVIGYALEVAILNNVIAKEMFFFETCCFPLLTTRINILFNRAQLI